LIIQIYTLCIVFGRTNNIEFSTVVSSKILKSVLFLYNLQDEHTGMLPNYGNNDGALFQKLSSCDYSDYRPQLQAVYTTITGNRLYGAGIWDENILWLDFGNNFHHSDKVVEPKTGLMYPIGGYYVLRDDKYDCFGVLRCANYKDRPAQADMMHFDFWCAGINVLCDPGTYSYNMKWNHDSCYFSTHSHNTVAIDSQDQMNRISRFLWSQWTRCEIIESRFEDNFIALAGRCFHSSGGVHTRRIHYADRVWWIQDIVTGCQHSAEINWNIMWNLSELDNKECKIRLSDKVISIQTDYNLSLKKGYISRYYGVEEELIRLTGVYNKNERDEIIFNTIIGIDNDIMEKDIEEIISGIKQ